MIHNFTEINSFNIKVEAFKGLYGNLRHMLIDIKSYKVNNGAEKFDNYNISDSTQMIKMVYHLVSRDYAS